MLMLDQAFIIHEDNHLLVVNKPAGLLTQPVPGDPRPSLEDEAKAYLKEVYNKPGRVFLHAVHRIDRQVSGLVIFARTDKALSRLNQAMRDGRIVKVYHALVEGRIPGQIDKAVRLRHFLSHGSHRAMVSDNPVQGGREALLEYRILRQAKTSSLIEVDLQTGRYHQIRAQLAYIGYPIVGDCKYGAKVQPGLGDGIGLHSYAVSLIHPVKTEPLYLSAPCPISWTTFTPGL